MGQVRPNDANIEAPRVSKRVIDTISKLFDTIPKGHWHYFCICKTSTLSGSPIDNWLNWLYLVIDFSSFGKHGAHNSLANNKVLQMYFYVWAPEGWRFQNPKIPLTDNHWLYFQCIFVVSFKGGLTFCLKAWRDDWPRVFKQWNDRGDWLQHLKHT